MSPNPERIEPQFDIAEQEARELARRATLPMPDAVETVVVGDVTTIEVPQPKADIEPEGLIGEGGPPPPDGAPEAPQAP